LCFSGGHKWLPRLSRFELPDSSNKSLLGFDGTYVITGGLGGLGLMVAQWLIEKGVNSIRLLSRSEASENQLKAIAALQAQGADVDAVRVDVSDLGQCQAFFASERNSTWPVKGIFHLAVCAKELDLEHFVCFSSIAQFGSLGQSGYAFANGYMDSVVGLRRELGLVASTIKWGPWEGKGLAEGLENRLEARGFEPINKNDGLRFLEAVIESQIGDVVVSSINWKSFLSQFVNDGVQRLPTLYENFHHLSNSESAGELSNIASDIRLGSNNINRDLLDKYLRLLVAELSGLKVESIDPNMSLFEYGFDSLVATQLAGKIEHGLGVKLSYEKLFRQFTLTAIADSTEELLGTSEVAIRTESFKRTNEHALSFSQERFWFLNEYDQQRSVYKLTGALKIRGQLNVEILERAFLAIIGRHEPLQTNVKSVGGIGKPFIRAGNKWCLHQDHFANYQSALEAIKEDASKPFDLEHEPLFRVKLYTYDTNELIIGLNDLEALKFSVCLLIIGGQ